MKKIYKVLVGLSILGTCLSGCNKNTKNSGTPTHTHTWGEATYSWAEDYSTCTAQRVCAIDEAHVESETAVSTYMVITYPTEAAEGIGLYTATFENSAFETQTQLVLLDKLEDRFATSPKLSDDGKTVTYGIYPQTNVDDSSIVSALDALTTTETNGWYLYNNNYYAKLDATPRGECTFGNGKAITSGETYWFKCEPIVWKVLSNNDGNYYVLSNVLLDVHDYYGSNSSRNIDGQTVYANNYKHSAIRSWLNNEFYNTAFALGHSNIQETTVDNSLSTIDGTVSAYTCESTQDKVFMPSYRDYQNDSYGFPTTTDSSTSRRCFVTDWTKARGASYLKTEGFENLGSYWTRSPASDVSNNAWRVFDVGGLGKYYIDTEHYCVRPSIVVRIA